MKMRKFLFVSVVVVMGSVFIGCMDSEILLSGYVKDSLTGEPIPNAIVSDMNYGQGNSSITDETGFYSYVSFCEEHTIEVIADGYKSVKKTMVTPVIPNSSPIVLDILLDKDQ